VQNGVDATGAVERVQEDGPQGGVGDDPAPHRRSEAEEEDRERDQRDRGDRSQELDHDGRRIEERAEAADQDADHDPDDDGDREPLGVAVDRRTDLAGERARPQLGYERARRRRRCSQAVTQVEQPDESLQRRDDDEDDDPADDVRSHVDSLSRPPDLETSCPRGRDVPTGVSRSRA
jgi:hypothetical protein